MTDFPGDDVLQYAVQAFEETIALKLKQLRRYVPKEKALTNTDLTGAFVEELVRGFIRHWIAPRLLLHGSFYFKEHAESNDKPLQIDGIVYDPRRGPTTLSEGEFVLIHPAFCGGVIEVKMTTASIQQFESRLERIYQKYLSHRTKPSVMGVVIADSDPEKVSAFENSPLRLYDHTCANICPIFVLFKEKDGEFEPHSPAIESMIRAMYHNLSVTTNYI